MRRRAGQVDQTRQRIVEATVELHGSVGPAATTIAAIADRAGAGMLTHIHRDLAALPEAHQQALRDGDTLARDVLTAPFDRASDQRRQLRAAIGHAISFWTWRSLCLDQGLTDTEAAEAMTGMILAITPCRTLNQRGEVPRQPAERSTATASAGRATRPRGDQSRLSLNRNVYQDCRLSAPVRRRTSLLCATRNDHACGSQDISGHGPRPGR